jgi:hypothetical protein
MPPTADSRFLSISSAVVAAMPIPGKPFPWDGAFPGAARVRAAKAIHRARPVQQSIEQSPTDAPKIRASAPRATHTFAVRGRQGDTGGRIRWRGFRHGEHLSWQVVGCPPRRVNSRLYAGRCCRSTGLDPLQASTASCKWSFGVDRPTPARPAHAPSRTRISRSHGTAQSPLP